jgi:hypothetical protein
MRGYTPQQEARYMEDLLGARRYFDLAVPGRDFTVIFLDIEASAGPLTRGVDGARREQLLLLCPVK